MPKLTSAYSKNLTIMLFVCLSLCLLSAVPATAQTVCTPSIKTDRGVYAEPTPPTLPAAGGTFCDPTFGTKIMRVTDATTVPGGAGTSYSYWPTFNSDNTKILVMEAGAQQGASIYNFTPSTFTLGTRLSAVPYSPPGNVPIRLDDAVWSYNDPDKLFVHTDNGTKIYSYKVSTQAYTLIKDLSGYLSTGQFVQQMSVAQDDDTFSFGINVGAPNYGDAGYIVYRKSTDTVRAQSSVGINEVRLDKTGRYLFVNTNNQGVGQTEVQIVDLDTSQVENLTDDAPDHAPSHYDVGRGMAVGNGNYLLGISARSLSTPHSYNEILDLTAEQNYGGFHLSMLADDEGWTLVSFYTPHATLGQGLQRELVQVATDGSGRVRRLAHHQSIHQNYYDSPRANISRDGRFVAFSSNWGSSGTSKRHDLFIVEIAPAPSIKTDRGVYPEPSPVTLPSAGGTFYDPTFGTRIMRVTDATTVPGGAGTSYSYWPTFNSDNTKILVMEAGAQQYASIYNFTPSTFTLGTRLSAVPYSPPGNVPIRLDDAVWSYNDPDKLFVHTDNGTKIYSYKVSTQAYTLIKDLSGYLSTGQFVQQMSVAQDDDTFGFTINVGAPNYGDAGYIVYRKSTDTVKAQSNVGVNEVRLDKTGRFLLVNTNNQGVGQIEVQVVNLDTSQVENLTDDAPDHAPSHYDVGSGIVVGNGNYLLGITGRSLSAPHSFDEILDLTAEQNYGGFHLSMLADNEGWTLVSFYTPHATLGQGLQRELVQVATDGSGRVRRLAHHQSIYQGYYDSPRANISRDGRFVAFSSNWGSSRTDLFIAKIEPAPSLTPGDTVWVDDAVPTGGILAGDSEGWNWVNSSPARQSGLSAHQSNIVAGMHQHFFYNATNTLSINTGDKLVAYVYLDPVNPPTEVMLQWNNGTWEHRAYWGANSIAWGTNGTDSRRYMGALPATGQWVRLEVPASQVGLEGSTLNGMAFTLYGGRATWDRAGKTP
jgi:hypothetical protein